MNSICFKRSEPSDALFASHNFSKVCNRLIGTATFLEICGQCSMLKTNKSSDLKSMCRFSYTAKHCFLIRVHVYIGEQKFVCVYVCLKCSRTYGQCLPFTCLSRTVPNFDEPITIPIEKHDACAFCPQTYLSYVDSNDCGIPILCRTLELFKKVWYVPQHSFREKALVCYRCGVTLEQSRKSLCWSEQPVSGSIEYLINTRSYLAVVPNDKIRPKFDDGWNRICRRQKTFHERYSNMLLDDTIEYSEKVRYYCSYYSAITEYNSEYPTSMNEAELYPRIDNLQPLKTSMHSHNAFYNATLIVPPAERYFTRIVNAG